MKVIAHRGLLDGPDLSLENNPDYISHYLSHFTGLYAEVDLWITDEKFYLGHDSPQYLISESFLHEFIDQLILHVKINFDNSSGFSSFSSLCKAGFHLFSHDSDDFSFTSKGWIWAHPRLNLIPGTIAVMPENYLSINQLVPIISRAMVKGVCTDHSRRFI